MQENEQPTAIALVDDRPHAITTQAPRVTGSTPADLIRYAMESGADLDRLERLMDMQEKWERREAEKAFADAMAAFKLNPPTIVKDKHVRFKTEKGITEYDHATIGNVTGLIIEALAQHGFSHSWKTEQRDELVIVTCTITHRMGHAQSVSLMANPDRSGGKNAIQSIISAQTYLQRHTLLAATGLATHDQDDDDGSAAGARGTDLRTEEADEWISKARACKTIAELDNVWAAGSKALLKKPNSYDEFKDAVAIRGGELEGK